MAHDRSGTWQAAHGSRPASLLGLYCLAKIFPAKGLGSFVRLVRRLVTRGVRLLWHDLVHQYDLLRKLRSAEQPPWAASGLTGHRRQTAAGHWNIELISFA
jgi:hypothetical protein